MCQRLCFMGIQLLALDVLRATSHTRLRAHDHNAIQALSLVEKVELVQVHFTLHLGDQRSMWRQGGCTVYIDFFMASNGSCLMVTWVIFRNHFLEVSVTQNDWETIALWTFIIVALFCNFIMCKDPHEFRSIEIGFGWGPGHIWLHTTLEGLWPHDMILEVCWESLWTLSFGLTISWSWLLTRVWKDP